MAESILVKKHLWEALGAEIAQLETSGEKSDRELLRLLNTPAETFVPGEVPVSRLVEVLLTREKWSAVVDARLAASPAGKAASAFCALVDSRAADNIMVNAVGGELATMVAALKFGRILDDADEKAITDACRVSQSAPSIGREIAIGEVCATHVYQARNDGAVPEWKGDVGIRSLSAAAITDTAAQVITDAETAAGAYEWSAEIDGDASTLIDEVAVFATAADWAAAPTGYVSLIALPFYATGGTAFDSAPPGASFAVSADAQYDFFAGLHLPPCRYFKVGVYNGSDQAIASNALDAWAYYEKITV